MTKAWVLSLSLHVTILIVLLVPWGLQHDEIDTQKNLHAYLYRQTAVAGNSARVQLVAPLGKSTPVDETQDLARKNDVMGQTVQKNRGNPDELLLLLHDMIAAQVQRIYSIHRHQEIYVEFTLYPDGHITNINLLEATASAELNLAMVQAIAAIQPIAQAKKFLVVAQSLKIRIIFLS